jgi:hypothetical protein
LHTGALWTVGFSAVHRGHEISLYFIRDIVPVRETEKVLDCNNTSTTSNETKSCPEVLVDLKLWALCGSDSNRFSFLIGTGNIGCKQTAHQNVLYAFPHC